MASDVDEAPVGRTPLDGCDNGGFVLCPFVYVAIAAKTKPGGAGITPPRGRGLQDVRLRYAACRAA